mgnify:FL=1
MSNKIEIVGLRPGEELSENLISSKELRFTRIDDDYIFILNNINKDESTQLKHPLSSENAIKMNSNELKDLIISVKDKMINTMRY